MKKLIEAFAFGQLQDFLSLLKFIEKNSIELNEVILYIKERKMAYLQKQRKINKFNRGAKRCPGCQSKMNLHPVNTNPGDQTGDNSKSVWVCFNKDCMEMIYNKEDYKEIYRNLTQKEANNA